jgi:hypothetical protein
VTITGTNLNTPAVTSVTINGAAATFVVVSDTSITSSVPCAATSGLGDVIVNNGIASTNTSADDFTVTASAAPTVTSFAPTSGAVASSVVITGTNFCNATDVKFNTTSATSFTVNSNTQITATVPPAATTGKITVTTPSAPPGVSTTNFTVTGGATTITSFAPTSGPVGTSVVITGTGFVAVTSVQFNGVAAVSPVTNSATQITAIVPTGATTGLITVTDSGGTATSATSFTVGPAATSITSFTPTSGPVGTSVVITGTGFVTVTSVKFNGIAAVAPVTNSATQITAIVPAGATTGPITVVDSGGTATSATSFTVGPTVVRHDRTVTLKLKKQLLKQLIASGRVTATDGFAACASNVTVKIQRFFSGAWHTVGTDKTSSNGSWSKSVNDKVGKYRAIASKVALNGGDDVCKVDISPAVKHQH